MAGEEVFEFVDAARRVHVFLRGDTGYGRLVHAHGFGDVVQHQRLHRFVAVLEEGALVLDDLRGDLHQRFVAAEQALDEPAGFLQLIAHEGVVGAGIGAFDEAGVLGVDAQARHGFLVELDQPAVVVLAHDDVGHHVFRFAGLDLRARARVEALDQLDDLAQLVFLELEPSHQQAVVAAAEDVEVVADQVLCLAQPRGPFGQLAQLQQQALAQVAGTDAGRFELLDAAQHDLDLVELDLQFGIEGIDDLLERLLEVALVVDAVDQGGGDEAVGVAHGCQVELPQQVALQAHTAGGAAGEVPLVVVIAGQAAGAGLVDVFPGRIHRQLVGNALAPVAVVEVLGGMRGFLVLAVLAGAGLRAAVAERVGGFGHRIAAVEIVTFFLTLEHGIGVQRFLDLLLQIERRKLE